MRTNPHTPKKGAKLHALWDGPENKIEGSATRGPSIGHYPMRA